jgi:hypothetical protein
VQILVISNVILFVLWLSPVRPHHEKYSSRRSKNWIFIKNPVFAPSKKKEFRGACGQNIAIELAKNNSYAEK